MPFTQAQKPYKCSYQKLDQGDDEGDVTGRPGGTYDVTGRSGGTHDVSSRSDGTYDVTVRPGGTQDVEAAAPPPTRSMMFSTSSARRWDWCNLSTAVFSIVCCPAIGIVSTVCAILAYVDHKVNDFRRSHSKRKLSWGLSVVAILVGMAIICYFMYFTVATVQSMIQSIQNMFGGPLRKTSHSIG